MATTGIIGVILAGGRATRMSGRAKAFLRLGETDLLTRAIARLRPQCEALVINANLNAKDDQLWFEAFGLPIIADSITDYAGPLAGILAGLDWAAAKADDTIRVLSVPVDGPFFPRDLAVRLQAAAVASQAPIACAQSAGRRHGVYGLWSPTLREDLRAALIRGTRKVDDWLDAHLAAYAEWSALPIDPFFNVNTPDDLAEAERYQRMHPED